MLIAVLCGLSSARINADDSGPTKATGFLHEMPLMKSRGQSIGALEQNESTVNKIVRVESDGVFFLIQDSPGSATDITVELRGSQCVKHPHEGLALNNSH